MTLTADQTEFLAALPRGPMTEQQIFEAIDHIGAIFNLAPAEAKAFFEAKRQESRSAKQAATATRGGNRRAGLVSPPDPKKKQSEIDEIWAQAAAKVNAENGVEPRRDYHVTAE